MSDLLFFNPGTITVQTSKYADFIADDHYLPVPDDSRVVIVNQRTYDRMKAMSQAEFQYFIGELKDFTLVEKDLMRDDHGW